MRRWLVPALLATALAAPLAMQSPAATAATVAPTTLTATVPSGTYRADATGKPITGTVTGGPRLVQVESRGRNGTWVPLAETTTGADGRFRIPTPTWWVTRATLRVYAPATSTAAAAASTDRGRIRVTRTYHPRPGNAVRYTMNSSWRWNPCEPIRYRVNTHLAWAGALDDIKAALHAISQATGLRFAYQGHTAFIPIATHGGQRPDDSDLNIGWTVPRKVPSLLGSTLGLGGSSGWDAHRTDGEVALDATQKLHASTRADLHRLRLALLLHEIGHVIGLDHVDDARSVMYPVVRPQAAAYNLGDLRGLAHLGAAGGCVS